MASRYLRYFGFRDGLVGLVQVARSRRSTKVREITVSHPALGGEVVLRTRSSDLATFGKVVADREYDLPGLSNIATIIDAGANIGLTTLYFAHKFPGACILALEPEASNFELLTRNVQGRPNIVCLHKALWGESGCLDVYDPGDGYWAFRTARRDGAGASDGECVGTVDCTTVQDLMAEYGLGKIDLLKIDIEGSEKEVFANSAPWISEVNLIVAELHDRFKPGCAKSFYDATASFDHKVRKGENVFVFRDSKAWG
jgi:FkbM family methyltransferase